MKWLIGIVVIILILLVGGYFLVNYISQPRLISKNSEPVSTCTDTDGNNLYEKGYSSYILPDGTKRGLEDACDFSSEFSKANVGVVREGYCDGANFKTELWSCGWSSVCRIGRCIKEDSSYPICSDSDGGINEKIKGSTTDVASADDSCWTTTNKANPELDGGYGPECADSANVGCYVYEYYCDGNLRQHKIIPCTNGCLNGACK
jgi:hypothetical protein